jgi:hypothetical protein
MRQQFTVRGALLDTIIEGPPPWPGEKWFHRDLDFMDHEELARERDLLRWRLRLVPPREHQNWPNTWHVERLARIETMLRRPEGRP